MDASLNSIFSECTASDCEKLLSQLQELLARTECDAGYETLHVLSFAFNAASEVSALTVEEPLSSRIATLPNRSNVADQFPAWK